MATAPEGYKYHTFLQIRYGDLDTLGHVNNSRFLTYIEQARVAYFHDRQMWDGQLSSLGLIVAKVTVEYKLPLHVEDGGVDVWTRVKQLGNKSFTMQHIIMRQADGEVASIGEVIMVTYDYDAQQTIPIPQQWRDAITNYEPALT